MFTGSKNSQNIPVVKIVKIILTFDLGKRERQEKGKKSASKFGENEIV